MARNFSCSNTVQVCQAAIDNADSFFLLGQTVDFGQINFGVCYQSCSGTPVGNGELGYSYSWDTENSNVASISGSSQNQTVNLYGAGIGGTNCSRTTAWSSWFRNSRTSFGTSSD